TLTRMRPAAPSRRTGGPPAQTGTSGALPLLLAFGGALLTAGLIIAAAAVPRPPGSRQGTRRR
ncbi:hypothetical protein, partial [Streptomyces sp. NPDC060333]|uniref:hypothetical protein n=1 Tax=Streptomyces sp. NPDC060333 TaxID=3347098 RepID=UPI0036586332